MSWKDALLDSHDSIASFLGHAIREFPQSGQVAIEKWGEYDLKVVAKGIEAQSGMYSFFASEGLSDTGSPYFSLDELSTTGIFRGKGFGTLSLKAALGLAHASGHEALHILDARTDGPSFWSRWGAVPLKPPANLSSEITRVALAHHEQLGTKDYQKLLAIAEESKKTPYLAWRKLSMSTLGAEDNQPTLRKDVMDICQRQDMLIPFGEPTTRALLEEGLGLLPPSRPTQGRDPFMQAIVNELKPKTSKSTSLDYA